MADATISVTVAERNPQAGQTQQGRPKLGIKTTAGKWVQVTGTGVDQIQVGQELVISEPQQFGKQWFAALKEIKALGAPSSNGHGTQPRFESVPKRLTWDEFERTFRAAHAMILTCEPDDYKEYVPATNESGEQIVEGRGLRVDRSAARATMLNTVVMALTKDGGRIEPAPEIPF